MGHEDIVAAVGTPGRQSEDGVLETALRTRHVSPEFFFEWTTERRWPTWLVGQTRTDRFLEHAVDGVMGFAHDDVLGELELRAREKTGRLVAMTTVRAVRLGLLFRDPCSELDLEVAGRARFGVALSTDETALVLRKLDTQAVFIGPRASNVVRASLSEESLRHGRS